MKVEIREKEVLNVVVDTKSIQLPNNRKEAIEIVGKMVRPFINADQQKEIIVSNKSIRHSATQDHGRSDVQCMGVIDKIIFNAVKLGEIPVELAEIGHTHLVEVYYCPVNIDNVQYSARLIVKQYENGGYILEGYQLYDLSSKLIKTKTDASYTVRDSESLAPVSAPVSAYKIRDLIHDTQENDQKICDM